jgi:4-aminobutyrate aminotransferase-like enzyme
VSEGIWDPQRRLLTIGLIGLMTAVAFEGLAVSTVLPAVAADLEEEKRANAVAERCRKKGLLLTTAGACLTMFPPLTMDLATAEAGLDIVAASV